MSISQARNVLLRAAKGETSGKVRIQIQGHCLKAVVEGATPPSERTETGSRGIILEMSNQSRKRMLEMTARLRHENGYVTFLTLTFGRNFPSCEESYKCIRAFHKRVKREWPGRKPACIWKKELQERGAPHFHLLYFDLPWINPRWIQLVWMDVIWDYLTEEEKDRYQRSYAMAMMNPEHTVQGIFTRIEAVQSWRKAVGYVAKYMTKRDSACGLDYEAYRAAGMITEEGEFISSGRWWGCFDKEDLPWAELREATVWVGKAYYRLRRIAASRWAGVRNPWGGGFTLFVDQAADWCRLMEMLGIPIAEMEHKGA